MQWSRWFIAQWLDPIGTVVGLFTAVLVFLTWFTVQFGERRQRARWFHEVRQHVGARPAILEIDLLPGKSIEASLQQFVSTHEALRNVLLKRA